jgi:hypothetical protein
MKRQHMKGENTQPMRVSAKAEAPGDRRPWERTLCTESESCSMAHLSSVIELMANLPPESCNQIL